MLGLVAPACLHLAIACVQVVELAGAENAKAKRMAAATNKRVDGCRFRVPRRWPVVWTGGSKPQSLLALHGRAKVTVMQLLVVIWVGQIKNADGCTDDDRY